MHLRRTLLLAALLLATLPAAVGRGQQFRMRSEIFSGGETEPVAETLTLFKDGVAYDFQTTGAREITVFDPNRARIILLNPEQQRQTTIAMPQLGEIIEELREQGAESKQAALFDPQFTTTYDEAAATLTLSSSRIIYQCKGMKPPSAEISRQYQRFADWFARLNSTSPGNLPPFARIKLNQAVADRGETPEEIELTIKPASVLGRARTYRSRHTLVGSLSNDDMKQIESVGGKLAEFEAVTFREYRGLTTAQQE